MNHCEDSLHTDLAGIWHILVDPRRLLEYVETSSPVVVLADLAAVTTEEQPRRDRMQEGFKRDREWLQRSKSDTMEMDAALSMMNAFALLPGNLDRNDSEEDLAMMLKLFDLLQEDYQTRVDAETQQLIANKYMSGTLKAIALITAHTDPTKPLSHTLATQPLAVVKNAVEDKRILQANLDTIGEDRDALETQLRVYRRSKVHKKTELGDVDDDELAQKLEETLRDFGAGKDGVRVSDDDHDKTGFDDIDDAAHAKEAAETLCDIAAGKNAGHASDDGQDKTDFHDFAKAVFDNSAGEALPDLGPEYDDVHAYDDMMETFLQAKALQALANSEVENPPEEGRGSIETAEESLLNMPSVAAVWNQMREMRKRYDEAQG